MLQIGWLSNHIGWLLQAQTNPISTGLGANWTAVAGSDGGNQYTNTINPANRSVFFRLIHP